VSHQVAVFLQGDVAVGGGDAGEGGAGAAALNVADEAGPAGDRQVADGDRRGRAVGQLEVAAGGAGGEALGGQAEHRGVADAGAGAERHDAGGDGARTLDAAAAAGQAGGAAGGAGGDRVDHQVAVVLQGDVAVGGGD